MFIKLVLLSLVLVLISVAGLFTNILLKRGGRFPATSIGKNREMAKRGITCPGHEELKCHRETGKGSSCAC